MSNSPSWLDQQQQDYQRKSAAWQQAQAVEGYDPNRFRQDAYGSWIAWEDYGKRSTFGWQIDHELPKSIFPALDSLLPNLRALHWRNNIAKSDNIELTSLEKFFGGISS